jgi:hypothetical protein
MNIASYAEETILLKYVVTRDEMMGSSSDDWIY